MFGFDVGLPDPELQQPSRAAELLSKTWLGQLVRDAASGVGAFGEAAAGRVPVTAGLRREDFTDIPGNEQPVDPWIKKVTDAGAFAMTGGGFGGVPAGAVGSTFAKTGAAMPKEEILSPAIKIGDMAEGKSMLLGSGSTDKRSAAIVGGAQAGRDLEARSFKSVTGPEASDPAYVYHATNTDRAMSIAERGLQRHRPGDFTDQGAWPDGGLERRNYFTPTAQNTWQFAPEDGTPTLLRVKRDSHPLKQEKGTGDLYSVKDVRPDQIEALSENGWVPLSEMVAPSAPAQKAPGAQAKPTPAMPARELEARPTSENLRDLIQANFNHAVVEGDKTVPLSMLKGGTGPSKTDADRVAKLREAMDGPDGYIERLVVDDVGNVIEGQHRLEALRARGEKKVPVTMVRDLTRGFDYDAAQAALEAFPMHSDQKHQLLGRVFETLKQEKGNIAAARDWEIPGYDKQFNAVLDALEKAKR